MYSVDLGNPEFEALILLHFFHNIGDSHKSLVLKNSKMKIKKNA